MTLGPARVMVAGVVAMPLVAEVRHGFLCKCNTSDQFLFFVDKNQYYLSRCCTLATLFYCT